MNLKIIKEKDIPLLSRKRVTLAGESADKTPSRLEVKEVVAKLVKAKPECVAIRHVYTRFGSKNIKVIAHVYASAEELTKIEQKSTVKKNTPPAPKADEE